MSSLIEKLKKHVRDRRVDASQTEENQRSQRTSLEVAIMKGFFTIEEAALYIGKSPKTVSNLKSNGLLEAVNKSGAGRKLITKKSIDKYIGVSK